MQHPGDAISRDKTPSADSAYEIFAANIRRDYAHKPVGPKLRKDAYKVVLPTNKPVSTTQ